MDIKQVCIVCATNDPSFLSATSSIFKTLLSTFLSPILFFLFPFLFPFFFLFFNHELDWLLEYTDPDSSSEIVSKLDMLVYLWDYPGPRVLFWDSLPRRVTLAGTTMKLCADKSPFDFGDSCVRDSWGALIPAVFVSALCLFSFTPIRSIFEPITSHVRSYLTLPEAEALIEHRPLEDKPVRKGREGASDRVSQSLSRTLMFVFVGIVETLCWVAYGSYVIYSEDSHWWKGARALIYATVWLFTVISPVARPRMTPPFDVLVVYLLLFAASILELGGYMYDHNSFQIPFPNWGILTLTTMNLIATTGMLVVVGGMPLALPSSRVKEEDIVTLPPIVALSMLTYF